MQRILSILYRKLESWFVLSSSNQLEHSNCNSFTYAKTQLLKIKQKKSRILPNFKFWLKTFKWRIKSGEKIQTETRPNCHQRFFCVFVILINSWCRKYETNTSRGGLSLFRALNFSLESNYSSLLRLFRLTCTGPPPCLTRLNFFGCTVRLSTIAASAQTTTVFINTGDYVINYNVNAHISVCRYSNFTIMKQEFVIK